MTMLLVALAGAVGAVVRYRIGVTVGIRSFPWATLGINLSGCFVLALALSGPATSRWGPTITAAVAVGLLGSFTTFSTFGYETFALVRAERLAAAAGYVGASLVGGLAATAIGYAAGRLLR